MADVITTDMRAVIAAQRLCFAATVTADGKPNLSPKGTIRVYDDAHLFFCDIDSPNTVANLEGNAWIELNVVDTLSRRGYRFLGTATIHRGGPVYTHCVSRIGMDENAHYDIRSIVLIRVERALPLLSPGYAHVSSEAEMRQLWRARRATLDAEFESYLATAAATPL